MLSLVHFFEGHLRKEETASAFLAMALEGLPRFRSYFASLRPALAVAADAHRVSVEKERVDLRLQCPNAVILVENKISASAVTQHQLVRYYEREVVNNPGHTIIAVLLAPSHVGAREVAAVQQSPQFRPGNDSALHLPWETLFDYQPCPTDPLDAFIKDGLKQVGIAIEERRLIQFPRAGERGTIRATVDEALELLKTRGHTVGFHRWCAKSAEIIRTKHSAITVYVEARFACEAEPPFEPLDVRDGSGRLVLTIRSALRLPQSARRGSPVAAWWRDQLARRTIDVEGVGQFRFAASEGRFIWETRAIATEKAMASEMARIGSAVVTALADAVAPNALSTRSAVL